MKSYLRSWLILAAVVSFTVELSLEGASAQRSRRGSRGGSGWEFVAKKYDTNGDGTVTAEEYSRGETALKNLDHNGDGILSKADWDLGPIGGRASEGAPEVGEVAPDFSLTHVKDASKTVTLSDFAGKQPVALIFGSCT